MSAARRLQNGLARHLSAPEEGIARSKAAQSVEPQSLAKLSIGSRSALTVAHIGWSDQPDAPYRFDRFAQQGPESRARKCPAPPLRSPTRTPTGAARLRGLAPPDDEPPPESVCTKPVNPLGLAQQVKQRPACSSTVANGLSPTGVRGVRWLASLINGWQPSRRGAYVAMEAAQENGDHQSGASTAHASVPSGPELANKL